MSQHAPEADTDALQEELAEVAREIARHLLQPVRDKAALRASDRRAAGLRRRIAEARSREQVAEPIDLSHGVVWRGGGAPLVSGG